MDWLDFREPVSTWTHLVWLLLAVPGTWYLWRRSRGDRPKQFSLLIFGLSLLACFGGSTLYHGLQASDDQVRRLEVLDCIGIYLLITGTYTAVAFNVLQGRWKWSVLLTAYLLAILGSGLRMVYHDVPPWLYTGIYLALGWGAMLCYFEIARQLSHRALSPFLLGGLLYSVGAVFNLVHWPVLWPNVVEAHEVFHLFAMAGSLTHYCFMVQVIVPFVPVAPDEPAAAAAALGNSLATERALG